MAKAKAKGGKGKPASKSEVVAGLAEATGLTKKQVAGVFEALSSMVKTHLKKGPGVFTVPGLLKLRAINKPAQPERQGINPFTKEPITIKAKPARRVVKANALKVLKDAIALP
jgi:nucleoid DNA-binding protein